MLVVRLDGSVPVKYGLRLKTGDKYKHLREALAELVGIDLAQLLLIELFAGTVRVSRLLSAVLLAVNDLRNAEPSQ